MIWLTWRQFRGQAVVAAGALAALTVFLVILGLRLRSSYETNIGCTGCSAEAGAEVMKNAYFSVLLLTGWLVVLVPGVLGAFWGAPLIARELETGTHRLVWNQTVTRTRWLAVKLGFVALVALVFTGLFSLLFTWATSPYDKVINDRFDPIFFPTRNIAPLGYTLFAVVAGIAIGLLAKRTVPAMAVTLAAFALLQILMPTVIRPNLQPPVTENVAFTPGNAHGLGLNQDGVTSVMGYDVPGAWMLTNESKLLDATGAVAKKETTEPCFTGGQPGKAKACLAALNLHSVQTYQPAGRYWTFQWLEFGTYVLLALLLAGYAFWRIPRGVS
jgi:ABC-type transport system involved in multi-copper enzyme maturation permease subunit